MEEKIKNELLASILLKVIDENQLSQNSEENELWKLGYHEACDMVLEHLQLLQKYLSFVRRDEWRILS
jgi:hypothetical protein